MVNEFLKGSSLIPAKVGKLAKSSEYNANLGLIAKDSFIPVNADGTPTSGDLGDETIGTNGTLIEDCKVRDGKSLKIYDASGILLNTATWASLLTASTYIDKYGIYGLVPSSNSGTPDEQVDVTAGRCIAEDDSTVLSSSGDTANLTNHITPSADTTYHLFLYRNASSGLDIVDFTTVLNPTAGTGANQLPNLDTGKLRRIGSLLTDSSGDILKFFSKELNGGIYIYYNKFIEDYAAAPTTTETLTTMSVPSGLELFVIFSPSIEVSPGIIRYIRFYNPAVLDVVPTASTSNFSTGTNQDTDSGGGSPIEILTNTSGQIAHRSNNTGNTMHIITTAYIDYRNQH